MLTSSSLQVADVLALLISQGLNLNMNAYFTGTVNLFFFKQKHLLALTVLLCACMKLENMPKKHINSFRPLVAKQYLKCYVKLTLHCSFLHSVSFGLNLQLNLVCNHDNKCKYNFPQKYKSADDIWSLLKLIRENVGKEKMKELDVYSANECYYTCTSFQS